MSNEDRNTATNEERFKSNEYQNMQQWNNNNIIRFYKYLFSLFWTNLSYINLTLFEIMIKQNIVINMNSSYLIPYSSIYLNTDQLLKVYYLVPKQSL